MTRDLRHALVPLFLLACLLFGGSPQGVWRTALLQVAGAGLLAWVLLDRRDQRLQAGARTLLILGLFWFALVTAQLIPLPPAVWSALPGRELAIQSFVLRDAPLPWLPWSFTPAETAAALPVMLVPLALMAAMLVRGAYRSRWCVAALLAGTFVSVLLGAAQRLEGGPYLYPIHNQGASGLFANSNHQATLLLVAMPFLAALIGRERLRQKGRGRTSRLAMACGGLILVLLGVALNGSLAALLLLAPVLLASLALAFPRGPHLQRRLGGLAVALLIAGAALLAWTSEAGTRESSIASRTEIYQRTAAAIADSMPLGTGLGSFEAVYRQYEDPAAVDAFYVNAAHSDLLQWLLETGVPGALLLAAFLICWARWAWQAWSLESGGTMARAGTVASAAILAHSLVDYPLRDPAIQALFAMSLAFMVVRRKHAGVVTERAPRHLGLEDLPPVNG